MQRIRLQDPDRTPSSLRGLNFPRMTPAFAPVRAWLRAHAVQGAVLLAAGTVALSVARFAGVVVAAGNMAASSPQTDPEASSGVDIASLGWFGGAAESGAAFAGGALALKGISQSSEAPLNGAFISAQGVEAFYHPGDMLPGDAGKLLEVFPDHVTIEHGQEISSLFMGEGEAAQAAATMQDMAAAPIVEDAPKTTYDSLAEVITYFQAEPERVLAQAGLHPVAESQDKGYRFDGNDTQQVFRGVGLQKNDVILAVNDMAIGDTSNDRFRVAELADKKLLTLKVQRGEQIIGLEYRLP